MLSAELNKLITHTGPEAETGKVMRAYWQPAALAMELEGERPIKKVTLMGEELVLFRDENGNYGLMDKYCSHRGADLCFGRLEDGGLRCPFHGWLFDHNGQCIEQPAEPEGSTFYTQIKQKSYPCIERNGIIFAYLGEGEPPELPAFDCFSAPDSHTFAFKGWIECNWLQALEVGIDPAHASFLHRFFKDESPKENYGQQFRDNAASTDIPMTKILRDFPRPDINVEKTDYGLRIISTRNLDNHGMHVRVTNQVFPNAIVIPMSNEMTITQWHVPIDDENCYWYAIFTSFGEKVDKDLMKEQRLDLYEMPDFKPKLNKNNNYGFDPKEQQEETYTGMGRDINVHDQWAVESSGNIQDRTKEHLGKSDIAIIQYRRILRKILEDIANKENYPMYGTDQAPENIYGPVSIDAISPMQGWEQSWREADLDRRKKSSWAQDIVPA